MSVDVTANEWNILRAHASGQRSLHHCSLWADLDRILVNRGAHLGEFSLGGMMVAYSGPRLMAGGRQWPLWHGRSMASSDETVRRGVLRRNHGSEDGFSSADTRSITARQ
jgi:hypothetical protein